MKIGLKEEKIKELKDPKKRIETLELIEIYSFITAVLGILAGIMGSNAWAFALAIVLFCGLSTIGVKALLKHEQSEKEKTEILPEKWWE